jgi:hypothetical protein
MEIDFPGGPSEHEHSLLKKPAYATSLPVVTPRLGHFLASSILVLEIV